MLRVFFLVVACLVPAGASAQLARSDSAGLAKAIAKAIEPPLRSNGSAGWVIVTDRQMSAMSRLWNPRVAFAIESLDSLRTARDVTRATMRVNISSVVIDGDSATVGVGLSRCNAARFIGASAIYVFRVQHGRWEKASEQKGTSARGACPRAYGRF